MIDALGCEIPVRHRNNLRGSIGVVVFVLATTASAGNDGLPWTLDGAPYPIHGSFVPNLPSWAGSNLSAKARSSWDGYGTDRYEPSSRDDGGSPSDQDPEPRREHLCDNPVDVVTGMKFEFATDFAHAALEELRFDRTWNGGYSGTGMLRSRWITNHDLKLSFFDVWPTEGSGCYPIQGQATCNMPMPHRFHAHRENGDVVSFDWNQSQGDWRGSAEAPGARIERLPTLGYRLSWPDGRLERYRPDGFIAERLRADGVGLYYTYDDNNRLIEITHTAGPSIRLTWSGVQLVTVHDPAGNAYAYGWEGGKLATVTFPDGLGNLRYHIEADKLLGVSIDGKRHTEYRYDSRRRVIESSKADGSDRRQYAYSDEKTVRTNGYGKQTTYAIQSGRIAGITGHASPSCAASFSARTFDASGRLETATDALGVVTRHSYDGSGWLRELTAASGTSVERRTSFERDAAGRLIRETLVGGAEAVHAYASDGMPTVTTLRWNGETRTSAQTYTRHPNGMLASATVDGPSPGDEVVYAYGAPGNLMEVRNANGHKVTYAGHNALGQPTRVTTAAGAVTEYEYDVRGRVVAERTFPGGVPATARYVYGSSGLLDAAQSADGNTSIYHYDAARRLIQVDATQPDNTFAVRKITYDAISQPIKVETLQDSSAGTVVAEVHAYEYDELGRLIAERSGAEGKLVARYAYDAADRRIEITNGKGEKTKLTYDPLGRVSSTTDPLGGVTKFTYDLGDRVTSVTDPRGLVTTYKYNGFGDLLELESPDTGKTTHAYRADSLRERTTRNDGSALVFGYDGVGRVTQVTGGIDQRTFAYDSCGAGFLCEAKTLRSGALQAATRFTFTPYGQMLTRVDTAQGVEDTTRYQFDAFGRLATLTYPGGLSVGYSYTLGRVTSMTATHNGTTQTVLSDVRYRPFGGPETWTYGNGLQRRYDVDDNGRLFGISATDTTAGKVTQSLTYGFDEADRIKAITNGAGPPTTQSFGYDANGRLAFDAISQQSGHIVAFDANGNRTRHTWGGETEQHAIDPHSNRLLAISGTSNSARHHVYDYDLRGNRIGDTVSGVTTAFAYDAFNRIKQVSRPAHVQVCEPYGTCRTLDAGTTTYAVNALDQRVAKSGPNGATRFVFGDQTRLLAEHGPTGWKHYIWFGGELVSMLTSSDSTILAWYEDLPITLSHPGLKYVHNDHLGRPGVVTSGYKVDLWRARNYAFDRNVSLDLLGGLNIGSLGQYHDEESGLVSNGYRDLSSPEGRYVQPDPLGVRAGVNTYLHVRGNPVSRVDPLGLADWFIGVDLDIVGINGGEFSVGLVLDTDHLMDSGIYGTAGEAVGANVGIALGAGYVCREIEGRSVGLDANIKGISVAPIFDEHGLNGASVSIGPGIGASVSRTETWTLSLRRIMNWLRTPQ